MKAVKGIVIAIAIVLLAAFLSLMFLPIDTQVALKMANSKGYEVPDTYDDILYRYYYNNLSDKEQIAYRIICSAFFANPDKGFPKQIVVPDLSNDELQETFVALAYDNPEFYFLGNKCSITSIGSVNYFVPQYLMTYEDYEESWEVVYEKVYEVIQNIPDGSDYEKELYIHDWLVKNCDYLETDSKSMVYTLHGVFADGKANCEGYSRATQYLLRACGVYNYIITGYANGSNDDTASGHMWNVVRIDDSMYNLDVTWDDYIFDDGAKVSLDGSASHAYFNISTKDMSATHKVDDEELWKGCTGESFQYYKNKGLLFDSYSSSVDNAMKSALAEALSNDLTSVEVAFTNKGAYDNALATLTDASKYKLYGIVSGANSRISADKRIDLSRTRDYSVYGDDQKFIIRFFFEK